MSALDQLPPDQRAALQLIVRQGRSYEDLANLLRTTPDAVRTRAQTGLATLAGDDLGSEERGRVGDFLLGQAGVGERGDVRRELEQSPAALEWAQRAHSALAGLGGGNLPDLPGSEGGVAEVGDVEHSVPDTPVAVVPEHKPVVAAHEPAVAAHEPAEIEDEDEDDTRPAAVVADPGADSESAARNETSPSRLGGIALLAAVALLVIAIVVALTRGGGNDGTPTTSSTSAPTTQSSVPSGSTPTSTSKSGTPKANAGYKAIAQVNLKGGGVKGIGQLITQGGGFAFLVGAAAVPSDTDVGVWLQGPKVAPVLLAGVKQNSTNLQNGTLRIQTRVPQAIGSYNRMSLTRETFNGSTVPKALGPVIATGGFIYAKQTPKKK